MSTHKDIIPPVASKTKGSLHPINQIKSYIMDSLSNIGFEIIEGPEIETEEYNFDMLNIKKSHPARQMHDTFYVNKKSNVLRTHTSPVQIRGMLQKNLHLLLYLEVRFIEKMMMQRIYRCFIKLKEFMLIKI
jgi:phenylalanyl-tRNA synthetase alpha subunit